MFSKIKKVLVSLALAASLALAPMNVSAEGLTKKSTSDGTGESGATVYMIGGASAPAWTIEFPATVTVDLDNNRVTPSTITGETTATDNSLSVKLNESTDFESKQLKVTPTFALVSDTDATITLIASDSSGNPIEDNKTKISSLGIGNDLLTFWNSTTTELKFTENDSETKSIPVALKADEASRIKAALPNEIESGVGLPRIKANQQIGTITFSCEFVSSGS